MIVAVVLIGTAGIAPVRAQQLAGLPSQSVRLTAGCSNLEKSLKHPNIIAGDCQ